MACQLDAKYKVSYVYRITNKLTGEYYIGIRSCNGYPEIDKYMGSGIRITASIKKYGKNAFIKEILEISTCRKNASQAEASIVTEELLKDPLCLNLKTGGEYNTGVVYSDETRAKISANIKKVYAENPEYGKALSTSIKKAYAQNPEYGKSISEMRKRVAKDPIHQQKTSEARKKLYKDEIYRAKMKNIFSSEQVKEKKSKSLKVYCLTETGKQNISNATKNTTYVNKLGITKRIKNKDIDLYLLDGWNKGSVIEITDVTKQKLSVSGKGRIWIFNSALKKNIKVKEEFLTSYIEQGWEKGIRKWNQSSTPEINLENYV